MNCGLCWNRSMPSVDNWISAPLSGGMPDFQVAAVFAQRLAEGGTLRELT